MIMRSEIKNIKNMKNISPELFRAYDIRGVVDQDLTPDSVHAIAQSIGVAIIEKQLKKNKEKKLEKLEKLEKAKIIIARDGRLSGPVLIECLKSGLMSVGVDVIDIGQVPTPVLYYATKVLGIRSGVMLTGSHNPPNYNGLKMVLESETIFGKEIQVLYEMLQSGRIENFLKEGSEKGQCRTEAIGDQYERRILEEVKDLSLKIVVDCGNGVTGFIAPGLFEKMGCEVIGLYTEVDGHFPHHHPDPSQPKNLVDLQKAVIENKADIGLAFDGDGDRLGVVDSAGKVIAADRLLMLYAQSVLKSQKGAKVLYDVKSSRYLHSVIEAAGGVPQMCATGHSFVKKAIQETGAVLAGELSGHVFFNDTWYGFDDGLYAAARLLKIIDQAKRKNMGSQAVFNGLPEGVATPEIQIEVSDREKFNILKKIITAAEDTDFFKFLEKDLIFGNDRKIKMIILDGLRVEYPKGFGLIRVSNTTPCLILRFEGDRSEDLTFIKESFKRFLISVVPEIDWSVWV